MSDGSSKAPVPSKQIAEKVEQVDPQLLNNLPPEQKEAVLRVIQQVSYHQGPLPPPDMLAAYDQLIPNGAHRLMSLLEGQTNHRQDQERRHLSSQIRTVATGQWLGFLLAVIFGSMGTYLTSTGNGAVGGVVFSTTIIGLVTVFVLGRTPSHSKSEATPQKAKALPKPNKKR